VREHALDGGKHPAVERHPFGKRLIDLDVIAARDQCRRRTPSDERPTSPPLVLDGLEQEPRFVTDNAQEASDRRRQVSEHIAPHRHDRVVTRERVEVSPRGPQVHVVESGVEKARKKHENSPVWHAPLPC